MSKITINHNQRLNRNKAPPIFLQNWLTTNRIEPYLVSENSVSVQNQKKDIKELKPKMPKISNKEKWKKFEKKSEIIVAFLQSIQVVVIQSIYLGWFLFLIVR